jgi:hypothetical protein|uniref:Uncharacterized protein n=1 Tax=viral metagenome TaxID=1070528 RepID=A0A6C0D9A0_9ZZZZ
MPQRIRLNLLNPQFNNIQTIRMNSMSNINNNFFNQNTQFRGFSAGRFNGMISSIVNSKPGCSACGK